jgi:5-methylcytosine-specific restriction enzyme A
MANPLRPCIDCGTPARGSRCPAHQREHERAYERKRGTSHQRGLGAEHRRIRAQVLREEYTCWLCGQPARPGDPLTADHVVARANGGRNERSNYRAAHHSCNSKRGARTIAKSHSAMTNRDVELLIVRPRGHRSRRARRRGDRQSIHFAFCTAYSKREG